MPEEIKGLLRAIVREQAETRVEIKDLDADVQQLAKGYRRSLVERYAVVVVLLVSIALVSLFIIDSLQRRVEFRQELRDLACLAVKHSPAGVSETVDDLRNRYDCPPFVASAETTPKGPTSTVTAAGRPGRTVTAHATATATVAGPGATRTVSLAGPRVTRTVVARSTRTVTATRTVTRCQVPLLPCATKGKG